jgi:ABC-2 type transport system permease protein
MPPLVMALHALTVAVLAVGLSGLAVGLGACMPNFKETDPSKIAVGFGGTLNLVAGLVFLVVTIGLMATPWHIVAAASDGDIALSSQLAIGLILGVLTGVLIGVAAVVIPLWAGADSLRQMEF